MALFWVFWEGIAVLVSGNIRPPTPVLHLLSSITTPAYLALPSPYRLPYSPVSLPAFLNTLPPFTAHNPTVVGSPRLVQPSAYKRLNAVPSPLIMVYPYALRLSRSLRASPSRSTSPDSPCPQFRLCNPPCPLQRYNSLTTTFQHPEHSPYVVYTASARARVAPPSLPPTVGTSSPCLLVYLRPLRASPPRSTSFTSPSSILRPPSPSLHCKHTNHPPAAFLCAAPLLSVPSGAAALFVGSHYRFHPPPVPSYRAPCSPDDRICIIDAFHPTTPSTSMLLSILRVLLLCTGVYGAVVVAIAVSRFLLLLPSLPTILSRASSSTPPSLLSRFVLNLLKYATAVVTSTAVVALIYRR
ncbi:hypothetical protein R3P38DRAFT_3295910 [Favolaschia claudopus]|uniref:Uncharacterized protein n=1 Tax=Favolaschia claudopus TaxID=2862362 RepID=A0AAV9ZAM8_9AGAR